MKNYIGWFWGKFKSFCSMTIAIWKMDWIDLNVFDEPSRLLLGQLFKCTSKKRDYIRKQRNIALLNIPSTFEEFVQGSAKQALRTNTNKAMKKGYSCRYFTGIDYLEDIMSINLSSDQRGGREMDKRYTDQTEVESFLQESPRLFGTFTQEGKLIAYIHVLSIDTMMITNKILGHADYLDNGLMYFMIAQLVKSVLDCKEPYKYMMYGFFLVGRSHAGYTYFKERCGFKGVNIRFHIH